MNCSTCKEQRRSLEPVPYIVHEAAMARNERTIKRLTALLLAVIILLFATVGLFVWYLNQYEFESSTIEYSQDGTGLNIIGDRNGVDYYGTTPNNQDTHP